MDDLQQSGLTELLGDLWGMVDTSSLIAMILFSCIGIWLYRRGRKRGNKEQRWIGLLLMFYSYVVSGPWLNWGVGLLLCGYAYYRGDGD